VQSGAYALAGDIELGGDVESAALDNRPGRAGAGVAARQAHL